MSINWPATGESLFPPVELADEDGLLAIGGDLSAARLLNAYKHGIFPWFNQSDPILWWSPDPRMILYPNQVRISKSLKKTIRKANFSVTADREFLAVIAACAAPRQQQDNNDDNATWITADMIEAYHQLHQLGYAHSIECWQNGQLVGGLYGVAIGKVFFGESMFSKVTDSSKVALVVLCRQLQRWGYELIDCQVYSDHLASLGAEEIPRQHFTAALSKLCAAESTLSPWQIDSGILQEL